MTQELFTKRHMIDAMKEASKKYPDLNIGATYMSLLKYERNKVIPPPKVNMMVNDREWRFYTRAEIDENIARIIDFKKQMLPTIKK